MTQKEILKDMPEEDKFCINCKYWPTRSKWGEPTCEGKECLNWSIDYDKNYFMPDESYLKSKYGGCEKCRHYDNPVVCGTCSRNYDEKFELDLEDEE